MKSTMIWCGSRWRFSHNITR